MELIYISFNKPTSTSVSKESPEETKWDSSKYSPDKNQSRCVWIKAELSKKGSLMQSQKMENALKQNPLLFLTGVCLFSSNGASVYELL